MIGNPPYIAWNEITNYRRFFKSGLYLGCNYSSRPNHPDAQPNLYLFFVILTLSILGENGKGCLIIPHEWMDDERAKDFTAYISQTITRGALLNFDPSFHVFDEGEKTIGTTSLLLGVSKSYDLAFPGLIDSLHITPKTKIDLIFNLQEINLWELNKSSSKITLSTRYQSKKLERIGNSRWSIELLTDSGEIIQIFERIKNL